MATAFCDFVKINSLGFQDSAYPYRIESKISKTDYPHNITEMDVGHVSNISLDKTYNSTSLLTSMLKRLHHHAVCIDKL